MTKAAVRLADGRAGGRICEQTGDALPRDEAVPEAVRAALAAFVAGFGIRPEQGDLLVERLLPGACARCDACPEEDPGACAAAHAEQVFENWLSAVLGAERLAGQPALPIGRAAYLACGGPTNWPDLVLVDEALPEVFVAAMRAAAPTLAPLPTPGTMAAQSLETWSLADAGRAAAELLDENLAWLTQARPLIAVPIKLGKPTS
jgi:hypothetical protein